MLYYYGVVLLVAFFFYGVLLLLKKKIPGLSARLSLYVVLWALILSFSLPLLISVILPGVTFLILLFLFLAGGILILNYTSSDENRRGTEISARIPASVKPQQGQDNEAEQPVPSVFPEQVEFPEQAELPGLQGEEPLLMFGSEYVQELEKEVLLLPERVFSTAELIESAFMARQEGNYALAAEKLKLSLAKTTDIAMKGLIYTELTFLYKEMGKYMEAAGMLQSFISENSTVLSPALHRQFTLFVEFLKTVDQLLIKADQPGIPYSKVPRLIKLRAEKILKG